MNRSHEFKIGLNRQIIGFPEPWSWVIDFDRFSGKAQVRRATLSCDSSYFVMPKGLKVFYLAFVLKLDLTALKSFIQCLDSFPKYLMQIFTKMSRWN